MNELLPGRHDQANAHDIASFLAGNMVRPHQRSVRVCSPTPIEVGFVDPVSQFKAPLRELSPFGLSVGRNHAAVKVGSILRLTVAMGMDCFRASAVVRVCLPSGFAVEFLSMTPEDRDLMHRIYWRMLNAVLQPRTSTT